MRARARTAGFTLLELLVVLVILVALAGIALRASTGLEDRARHAATARTLEALRGALLGDLDASGSFRPGFLSDVGRLPATLGELLERPSELSSNALQVDATAGAADPVRLAVGWRGPYVFLAVGESELLDGWGGPFAFSVREGLTVTSFGRDGLPGVEGGRGDENGYDADLVLTIQPQQLAASVAGTVTVRVRPGEDAPCTLVVRAWMPDPATGQLAMRDAEALPVLDPEVELPVSLPFAFSEAFTPGVRAFRAYLVEGDVATPVLLDEHAARGAARAVLLPAGGTLIDLEITQLGE